MTSKRRSAVLFASLVAILGVVLLAGCQFTSPGHPQSTFDPQGPVAERQMELFWIIFWAAMFVMVVVGGGLLYTVFRFRRKDDRMPEQTHGNTKLEVAWTIAPAIVLAIVAVPTVTTQFYISETPPGDVMEINVSAHQWWWEIEYPDSGVQTANEIHVPLGRPIEVNLTSSDVLHSFWIPKLAGKLDIIPGKNLTMWFQADNLDANPDTPERDAYFGQCAEHCGESHAWMRFRVFVHTQEEFDAWTEAQLAPAAAPGDSADDILARAGFGVFAQKGCTLCHAGIIPATYADLTDRAYSKDYETGEVLYIEGPNLGHLASRSTMAAGIRDLNAENLREWLEDPNEVKPGNLMSKHAASYNDPDLALTDTEITELVAYLLSLK